MVANLDSTLLPAGCFRIDGDNSEQRVSLFGWRNSDPTERSGRNCLAARILIGRPRRNLWRRQLFCGSMEAV